MIGQQSEYFSEHSVPSPPCGVRGAGAGGARGPGQARPEGPGRLLHQQGGTPPLCVLPVLAS